MFQVENLHLFWNKINKKLKNESMFIGVFKKISLINLFWLRWVFIAACGLSLVVARGGYSSLLCTGFSFQWLLLLWSTGSRCEVLNSCGMRAQ